MAEIVPSGTDGLDRGDLCKDFLVTGDEGGVGVLRPVSMGFALLTFSLEETSGLEGTTIASSISSSESSIFSADLYFPICFVFLGIGCAATFCPDAVACCDRPFRICCLEI